ncbi:type I methionyl aminopeptidase, partial [bacterium]|nr:type I methionyl aminopeptidase [bacterium]
MIVIKNKHAINKMRTAGNLLSGIFGEIEKTVVEGANTFEIDATIERLMKAAGLVPECKGYAGYRHATCISVNDILIHGVPSTRMVLKSGDFVTIDAVASYRGYCADMARCFFVGTPVEKAVEMAKVAQAALDEAIKLVRPGIHLSDISAKIQSVVEAAGCNVVRDFVGHGVGKDLHEEPEIPNYGVPGEGPILQVGMTLAIE